MALDAVHRAHEEQIQLLTAKLKESQERFENLEMEYKQQNTASTSRTDDKNRTYDDSQGQESKSEELRKARYKQ